MCVFFIRKETIRKKKNAKSVKGYEWRESYVQKMILLYEAVVLIWKYVCAKLLCRIPRATNPRSRFIEKKSVF